MNNKWNYEPPTYEQIEEAKALSKEIGISPILCCLLAERGIKSVADSKNSSALSLVNCMILFS